MEKNLIFRAADVRRARMKLTWAQLEVMTGGTDEVQVIIAGDDESVEELRAEQMGEEVVVAQPHLGYAKEILPRTRWLQICLRTPADWNGDLDIDTISGMIGVHNMAGGDISLSTVNGAMHVHGVSGSHLSLHTVSGAVKGDRFVAERASLRTVSGRMHLEGAKFGTTKLFSVNGEVNLSLKKGCRTLDAHSIAGSLSVEVEGPAKASLHSLGGQFVLGEEVRAENGCLEIAASSVSGDLVVKGKA